METQTAALHREGRIWRGLLLLLLETGSRKGFTTAPCWGWRAGGIGRVAPVIGLPTHFQVGPHRLIAQRDTGLRNSFPSSAGVRAGAGAGGTRRREGFSFLALAAHRPGRRGASLFSSLMRGVVCSARGARAVPLSPAFGGRSLSAAVTWAGLVQLETADGTGRARPGCCVLAPPRSPAPGHWGRCRDCGDPARFSATRWVRSAVFAEA